MQITKVGIAVLKPEELLTEGEQLIDQYDTEIARWKDGTWSSVIPPLNVIVTGLRIILQLRTRKKYEPAIIPTNCVKSMKEFSEKGRPGIILFIETGEHIAYFIPHKRHEEILRNMRTVTAPSTRPTSIDIQLDLGSLRRLIDRVSDL